MAATTFDTIIFDLGGVLIDWDPRYVYRQIFDPLGGASTAMMVGNSLRSDVLPVLEIGAWGVHVPHELTWAHEHAEAPSHARKFRELPDIAALPDLLAQIQGRND